MTYSVKHEDNGAHSLGASAQVRENASEALTLDPAFQMVRFGSRAGVAVRVALKQARPTGMRDTNVTAVQLAIML